MSMYSSGRKLEGFFTGKGFYIVLFLCAAVIGLSAWIMATGNGTMENHSSTDSIGIGSSRVETVIIPPQSEKENLTPAINPDTELEPVIAEDVLLPTEPVEAVEAPFYIMPVQGELDRAHDLENLSYDVTLGDWRTHEGVDIAAPLGATVSAACAGTIVGIEEDGLYGSVICIEHADGMLSVYANLGESPSVNVGDWVEAGQPIGSVGSSALCESSQPSHLHFAMRCNGESVNPMDYLSA